MGRTDTVVFTPTFIGTVSP